MTACERPTPKQPRLQKKRQTITAEQEADHHYRERGRPSLQRKRQTVTAEKEADHHCRERGRPSLQRKRQTITAEKEADSHCRERGRPSLQRKRQTITTEKEADHHGQHHKRVRAATILPGHRVLIRNWQVRQSQAPAVQADLQSSGGAGCQPGVISAGFTQSARCSEFSRGCTV